MTPEVLRIQVLVGTETDGGNLNAAAKLVKREGITIAYDVYGPDRKELAASMKAESKVIASMKPRMTLFGIDYAS